MKQSIRYIDGRTGIRHEEAVCGEALLRFLYHSRGGLWLAALLASYPFFSRCYGWWQALPHTKRKILPFVKRFQIPLKGWEHPLHTYPSFSAFFIRKLRSGARLLGEGLVLPADGRALFYQNVANSKAFCVKGQPFTLSAFLQDEQLAIRYHKGSMVLLRLAPSDYHRFHFPCRALPSPARSIPGALYSVNPLTMTQRMVRMSENKRVLTVLKTESYGELLMIEIGATCVGSIHQTYEPGVWQEKGAEKGYFSLGGSAIVLLAEEGAIKMAPSFLANSAQQLETLVFYGWSLAKGAPLN